MRRFLVSAAMIGLIAGLAPAFAQDREHHDQGKQMHNDDRGGQEHGRAPGGPQPQAAPAIQAAPQRSGPPREDMRDRERGRDDAMRGPREGRPNRPESNFAQPNQRPPNAPENAMRGPERQFGPNNAMRGPERRFDRDNAMRGPRRDFSSARNFHRNFRAERRFRAAPYVRPRGFYAHRWSWGETLPPFFWAQQYWILDFASYDLPPPPFGAVWVRVGDDAVLIDQDSGMIIEVDYGVFY